MFRFLIFLLAFLSTAALCEAKTFSDMFGRVRYTDGVIQATLGSLDYQQGTIDLKDAQASLTTTSSYYFLGAEDTAKITRYVWHWSDDVNRHILGMFQTASFSPVDANTWYSTILYEPGFVSKSVISAIDKDTSLKTLALKAARYSSSASEADQPTHIVGWATLPKYNPKNNSLYWAVEADVGDGANSSHRLYHYLCLFGRTGTLYLFINSDRNQSFGALNAISNFINQVRFTEGQTYLDHVKGDPIALQGILGLKSAGDYQLGSSLFGPVQGSTDLLSRIAVLLLATGSTLIVLAFKAWIRQTFMRNRFG